VATAVAVAAVAGVFSGCPNGCDWPEDECAKAEDCLPGEVCAWTGNDGVGGHDACFVVCAESPADDPCGRVACEPGRRYAPAGVRCLGSTPEDDPAWETRWPDGSLRAVGAWSETAMGRRIDGCACPGGQREGRWAEWAEDGLPLWERTYLGGLPEGEERQWYDNGVLQFRHHHSGGLLDGDYEGWYRNEQAEYRGLYRNNLGQGTWTYWHLNGAKRGEGTLVDGVRRDDWLFWDEDGNPVDAMPPRSDDGGY
jgi:hypothetical protein